MSSRRRTRPRAVRVYATSIRRDPVDQRRLARALLAVALTISRTPPEAEDDTS